MYNSIPDVESIQKRHSLRIEKKRLKKVVDVLPFDCWSYVLQFLDQNNDFLKVVYSVRGLYNYIKIQNSFCTRNRIFKVFDLPPNSEGQIYGHIHRIDCGYPRNSSSKEFKNVNKSKLLKTIFKIFPNLSSFTLECGGFELIKSCQHVRIEILPRGCGGKILDKLKEIEILYNGDFQVNLRTDILPNLESIHVGRSYKFDVSRRWDFGRGGSQLCKLFCYGKKAPPLPRLRRLIISSRLISMNPDLVSIILQQLRFLKLQGTNIHGFCKELTDLPSIEEVHLDSIRGDEFSISKLPCLRKLIIISGDYVRKWDIQFNQLNSLEESYLDKVEVSGPNTFLDAKKLRNLSLDLRGKADQENEWFWINRYEKVSLGGFRRELRFLKIESTLSSISILSLPSSVRELDVFVKEQEIVVQDDLVSCKKSVEKISIRQYWREIRFPDVGVTLSFFKGSHSFTRKNLYFSKFLVLKELILTNYLINEIRVSKCPVLEKIEFRFRSFCPTIVEENSTELFVISDCPNLRELFLDDNISSYTQIRGRCEKLRRLRLRDSKSFPSGIDLTQLTELELTECYPTLFFGAGGGIIGMANDDAEKNSNNNLRGIFFPCLRRLLICQRFYDRKKKRTGGGGGESVISVDSDDTVQVLKNTVKDVAVARISGLPNLEFLRIRTRVFNNGAKNESGIVKISSLNPSCVVEIEEGDPMRFVPPYGVVVGNIGDPAMQRREEEAEVRKSFEYLDGVSIRSVRRFGSGMEFMKFFGSLKTVVEVVDDQDEDGGDLVFVRKDLLMPGNRGGERVVIDISDDEEGDDDDGNNNNTEKEVIVVDD